MYKLIREFAPIEAARWIGRDPCVSFIRRGSIDLAINILEDWNQ
jgi:hypothetical protein